MLAILKVLALFYSLIACIGAFDLVLIHTNDIHTRFEQSASGGTCDQEAAAAGKCYGGSARLMTKISEIRSQSSNVLLVDAGDMFHGTMWYYVYKGKASRYFMNLLKYDLMALGNHEFDGGITKLSEFLKAVNFSVISANIEASKEPAFSQLFSKYKVLTIGGEKIGFIGYTTRNTPDFSIPGPNLIFTDEITAVRAAVEELQKQGVNKIIAMGHSGYNIDQQIAAKVCGIDAIIGGHTHTFLYSGTPPTNDKPSGPYPTIVKSECASDGNKEVPVVQAFEFGKYLGNLQLTFDDNGAVTKWSGKPILLDSTIAQDPSIERQVQQWKKGVDAFSAKEIGRTHVYLDGSLATCGLFECNMGNLLVDAMVEEIQRFPDSSRWANASIALNRAADISESIDNTPPGIITISKMHGIVKYDNTVDELSLTGSVLKEALEISVANYNVSKPSGLFLQVSGLQIVYDVTKPPKQRVHSVQVICTECRIPKFVPLNENKVYKVLAPSYIARGFGGYAIFKNKNVGYKQGSETNRAAAVSYITARTPITARLDGRIRFIKENPSPPVNCPNNAANGIKPLFSLAIGLILINYVLLNYSN